MPSIFQALLEGTVACHLSRKPSWRGQLIAIFFRRPCLVGDCCFPFCSWTLFGGGHFFAIFSAGPTWLGQLVAIFFKGSFGREAVVCNLIASLIWRWAVFCHHFRGPYCAMDFCFPSFSQALLSWGQLLAIFFAGPIGRGHFLLHRA